MEYDPSDSSGTDDDLPPSHQHRSARGGRVAGNGRAIVGAIPYPRVQNDMESQIHRLEQEAYSSVLRAFKAQSDAITWEKESLITELRKELRVSDDEHRELLSRVNADDVIRKIREWRQACVLQSGKLSDSQQDIPKSSPAVSASRKRQKTSQHMTSLSLCALSPVLHSQPVATSVQPSASAAKKGAATGAKGKKPKLGQIVQGASSMKSMHYPAAAPSGRAQVSNRSGSLVTGGTAEPMLVDPLVGRKVLTRWPDDNNFYEAVITDYKPIEGRHALVYDIGTNDETWEWVNLKDIPAEDIIWPGEDIRNNHLSGRGTPGRGIMRPKGRGAAASGTGRGKGSLKNNTWKDFLPSSNGIGKKNIGDVEIFHTDSLIKEVEKVFNSNHPDALEIEKAKKALRVCTHGTFIFAVLSGKQKTQQLCLQEHEQSLIDAISRLADISDCESAEEGEQHFSHCQSMDRDTGWSNWKYAGNQHGAKYYETAEGREGSDGDQMVVDGAASD